MERRSVVLIGALSARPDGFGLRTLIDEEAITEAGAARRLRQAGFRRPSRRATHSNGCPTSHGGAGTRDGESKAKAEAGPRVARALRRAF